MKIARTAIIAHLVFGSAQDAHFNEQTLSRLTFWVVDRRKYYRYNVCGFFKQDVLVVRTTMNSNEFIDGWGRAKIEHQRSENTVSYFSINTTRYQQSHDS